ncbi:hypothetical protein [Streptomyces sp. Ac-502]|uniref:hypothetical protein n=1 Tax=Streptomyces sp. Ac-502 TaxID=3342801 RepID=UPI0038622C58
MRLLYDSATGLDTLTDEQHEAYCEVWPANSLDDQRLLQSESTTPETGLEAVWAGQVDGLPDGQWVVVQATGHRSRMAAVDGPEEAERVYEQWVREYVRDAGVLFVHSEVSGCGRGEVEYADGGRYLPPTV